ncbi:MAG: nucleotide pyrophosphohydrolase [Desulfocapsa sp.]|nr:MAG: nucleotide pyrophosphohydrolase [Desulfocapsa sp.]
MNRHLCKESNVAPFQRLSFIVKTLRGSHGCPWDQKQTVKTLKKYLLEEAAELAEAMESGDAGHVCEETGDLYFILALVTTIFEEQREFSADDALNGICEKMIRRHPHVFAGKKFCSEDDLRIQWERIKAEEKGEK